MSEGLCKPLVDNRGNLASSRHGKCVRRQRCRLRHYHRRQSRRSNKQVPSRPLLLALLGHLLEQDDGADNAVSSQSHVSASRLRVRVELDGPTLQLDSSGGNISTSHYENELFRVSQQTKGSLSKFLFVSTC